MSKRKYFEFCVVDMHDNEIEFLYGVEPMFIPIDFIINIAYILEEYELTNFICFSGFRLTSSEIREISNEYLKS